MTELVLPKNPVNLKEQIELRLNKRTHGEENEMRNMKGKATRFHAWDNAQLCTLIDLVVKYGHEWHKIARIHNQRFSIPDGGRTGKAHQGMFARLRDGFMALRDPELKARFEDNPHLWERQERKYARTTQDNERLDKLEANMDKILDLLTGPSSPVPLRKSQGSLDGLPPGRAS